jgi:hypothetical protein
MTTLLKKQFSFLVLTIVVSLYSVSFSQQDQDLSVGKDSVYRYQGIIPPIEFQYDLNEIFNKPLTYEIPEEALFNNNPSTVWLRTELMVSKSSSEFSDNAFSPHFTSSLYEKHLENSKFDMVNYILGVAQTSAVAYMAYRHIKKYGFWK